jgi:magnesium chelatase family protein
MVVRVATVAFEGIEARPVDVQVQIANGNVGFTLVAESRERVRAALNASGLALPAKRITVNLAPPDDAVPNILAELQLEWRRVSPVWTA